MAERIIVRGAKDDRRVVVAETHPDHPEGEAWVVNDGREVEVALTPEVSAKLATRELLQVTRSTKAKEKDKEPKPGNGTPPPPTPAPTSGDKP
jgi:hypothetical protein